MAETIRVELNGKERDVSAGLTVLGVAEHWLRLRRRLGVA